MPRELDDVGLRATRARRRRAIALLLFLDAFLLLRRRGRSDHAGWSRAALFVLAVALGTPPLVSPLDEAGDSYLLSAHMLQHVLIGDVVPA